MEELQDRFIMRRGLILPGSVYSDVYSRIQQMVRLLVAMATLKAVYFRIKCLRVSAELLKMAAGEATAHA